MLYIIILRDPLYFYKTLLDPDTLYPHEVIMQKYWQQFRHAMKKKIDDRIEDNNFTLVGTSKLLIATSVLPAMWQLKDKWSQIYMMKSCKVRLNIDGSRMNKGVHCYNDYYLVAPWNSNRLMLTMTAVHGWYTKELDYMEALPPSTNREVDLY